MEPPVGSFVAFHAAKNCKDWALFSRVPRPNFHISLFLFSCPFVLLVIAFFVFVGSYLLVAVYFVVYWQSPA